MDRTRQAVDKIGFPAVTSQLEGREGEEKYMWDLDRLTIWAIIWVVTSFSIPRPATPISSFTGTEVRTR